MGVSLGVFMASWVLPFIIGLLAGWLVLPMVIGMVRGRAA